MRYDEERELNFDPELQMLVKPLPFLDKIQKMLHFPWRQKPAKSIDWRTFSQNPQMENFSQKKGPVMISALQMGQPQHYKELAQNFSGWF